MVRVSGVESAVLTSSRPASATISRASSSRCVARPLVAAAFPRQVAYQAAFSEDRAHLIEAGSDLFLMPSRYEPCGLNQMYSMRYGTVPIVHAVGGLADTVSDYAPKRAKATGFVFEDYTAAALMDALSRALALFKDQKKWRTLQSAGMRQDFSWDRSAAEYVKIYERLLKARSVSGRP